VSSTGNIERQQGCDEMNIRALLMDPEGKDWNRLLGYWRPPLPPDATLWFVNLLGEAFVATTDGAVHWLVVGTGTLSAVAPTREAFAQLLDRHGNAETWLRIPLVESCRAAGITLGADECYGFKVPPRLLGKYEASNLQPTNVYSHYSWLSHMTRQDEIYWTGD
jgi:hypothetical protein